MFSISLTCEISAAHRLVDHPGGCGRLHGHNYIIDITLSSPSDKLDGMGFITDFGNIKKTCVRWLDENWDHKLLLWERDPLVDSIGEELYRYGLVTLPLNPTAEHMAALLTSTFARLLLRGRIVPPDTKIKVSVRETSKGVASYELTEQEG